MAELPLPFTEYTRQLMGEERFERFMQSFEEEPPVSIRLNPKKVEADGKRLEVCDGEAVAWCRNAYYLRHRPAFTMDPLFHAGCYYVQEAASMFLDEVLRQLMSPSSSLFPLSSLHCLDLCAAPGGKSTLLRSALPEGCVLYSNEPIRQRASILTENVAKWGGRNHIVTNAYPRDYRQSKMKFDLILCDVPCSGEGMFRKDETTIREWSPLQVEKCWKLQRDIISDIWPCLNEGGLLIYSTCTFNTKENEENIQWILSEYDAEVVPVSNRPEWNITGSLFPGFTEPVYRFIPGITRSEGLFLCVLRKPGNCLKQTQRLPQVNLPFTLGKIDTSSKPAESQVELTYQQAISYLRGEALVLPPETPRDIIEVTFMGHPLGQVKNIGTRANNLYPKPWRIKTTHYNNDYEAILRHTESHSD